MTTLVQGADPEKGRRSNDGLIPCRMMIGPRPHRKHPMASLATDLTLHTVSSPLRVDEGGTVRVGKSRVSLDVIVEQYENGMSPEDMVRAYDTLALADVHAAIAYYLRYRDEVTAYLNQRAEE